MLGKLISLSGVLALIYIAFVAFVYLTQSRMVYFPTSTIVATPQVIGLPFEDVNLTVRDGVQIHGWYVRGDQNRWTVLMLHGNGGNISHRLDTLRILDDLGADTLIIDYPGYGLSGGRPDEQGTYDAALAAWRFLTENGTDPARIILFGRSLGGVVAMWLAERVDPAALILESTFTSLEDMASHHYPFLPVSLISRYDYDAVSAAPAVTAPVLTVHSPQDEIVPFELGTRLHDALPGRKTFLEIRGGHNEGFLVSGRQYTEGLQRFLESL